MSATDWQDALLTCDVPGCPGSAAPWPGLRPADHTCALASMTADGRPGRGNPMEGLPGTGTQEDDPTYLRERYGPTEEEWADEP